MLEDADLFVMPSRTEGLPRALLEAMAKGLPCVASRVGGIPELLSEEALVAPDDPAALAAAIARFAHTPALMDAEAQRNLAVAHHFDSSVLAPERARFVDALRGLLAGGADQA